MPNWCGNKLFLTGEIAKIKHLVLELLRTNSFFELIAPTPKNIENSADIELEIWGTKWDISVSSIKNIDTVRDFLECEDNNTLIMVFNTAWSPPIKVYDKLFAMGFDIYAIYWEPGSCFCGCYNNGEKIEDRITGYRSNLPLYLINEEEVLEDFPEDDSE